MLASEELTCPPPNDATLSLIRKALFKNKCSILDVGCGNALIALQLAKEAHFVTAIDQDVLPLSIHNPDFGVGGISLPLKKNEEVRIEREASPGSLKVIQTNLENLETKPCFDVVLLLLVIHYAGSKEAVESMLKKSIGLLRKGGTIALSYICDEIPIGRGLEVYLPCKDEVRAYFEAQNMIELYFNQELISHSHGNDRYNPLEDAIWHQHQVIYEVWSR
jgi:2-polyprenyl-3-methyl-5-hydroxy-6-metoxy-1,4-benzoquinol methylase